jgi:hypothetical protein
MSDTSNTPEADEKRGPGRPPNAPPVPTDAKPGLPKEATIEVELLRKYVPENIVNEDGSLAAQPNDQNNVPLAAGTIVRLPKKEASRVVQRGIATLTDNSFGD